MDVREIHPQELPQLLELYHHLHSDGWLEDGPDARRIWEAIRHQPGYHIVVAQEEGMVVSSCTLVLVPNLTHRGRPYGLVENVVTHPAYRGRGFASACLDFARKLAQGEQCYKLMLMTGSKKQSTLDFYRNAGYHSGEKTGFVQWLE